MSSQKPVDEGSNPSLRIEPIQQSNVNQTVAGLPEPEGVCPYCSSTLYIYLKEHILVCKDETDKSRGCPSA